MRQGIALMAWRTFVVKKFIALAKLIEKVGKAPKDRLLKKVGVVTVLSGLRNSCSILVETSESGYINQYIGKLMYAAYKK